MIRECQIRTFKVRDDGFVGKESVPCKREATTKHMGIWMCDFHYDAMHPDGRCQCELVDTVEEAAVFPDVDA